MVNDLFLEVEKDVRRSTVGVGEAAEDLADHALVILLLLLMFILQLSDALSFIAVWFICADILVNAL